MILREIVSTLEINKLLVISYGVKVIILLLSITIIYKYIDERRKVEFVYLTKSYEKIKKKN